MSKHRHYWRVSSWSGDEVEYSCACGERYSRNMTKIEKKKAWRGIRLELPKNEDVHYVWHKTPFPENFHEERGQMKKISAGKAITKFAKKYPESVICLGCDDSFHAGSDLFLFVHESKRQWMGVTVIMIPQCDGKPPAEFFLYPHDMEDLLEALKVLKKRMRIKKALERQDEKKNTRWWNQRAKKG